MRIALSRCPFRACAAALALAAAALVLRCPGMAGEVVLVEKGQPKCVFMLAPDAPGPHRAVADVLKRRIRARTRGEVGTVAENEVERLRPEDRVVIVLGEAKSNPAVGRVCSQAGKSVPSPETLGPGGFAIHTVDHDGRTWFVLAGADVRGTVCAAGKFLRKLDFDDGGATVERLEVVERIEPASRMYSQPQKPAQWHNAYLDAPIERLREYVEDMAMWGTDSVASLCAWQMNDPFKPDADAASKGKWQRVRDLLLHAQSLGMDVGYFDYPNCVYEDQLHLRDLGGKFRYPKDVCPSIPEARAVLLANRENVYRSAKEAGLRFSFLIHNPYDFGGCDCEKCSPWIKTYVRLSDELCQIARKHHPGVKVYLTTWACKPEERRMLLDLLGAERPEWVAGVLDRPGVELPEPYVSVGWQTIFGCGPREVYGKMGADPLPGFLQKKIREFHDRGIRVIHSYSEGTYDDINNMVVAQVCRNPFRTDLGELLAEYAHAAFGTGGDDSRKVAELILTKFATEPSGRFNAALHVEEPEQVLAALEDIETRMPDWGRRDWRYGILKVRVQLEVVDKQAQALGDLRGRVEGSLAKAAAAGDEAARRAASDEAKTVLTDLESSLAKLHARSKQLTDHLYNDLYGTPDRDPAHWRYEPTLPDRASVPKMIERCDALLAEPGAARRREGVKALLETLRKPEKK